MSAYCEWERERERERERSGEEGKCEGKEERRKKMNVTGRRERGRRDKLGRRGGNMEWFHFRGRREGSYGEGRQVGRGWKEERRCWWSREGWR